MKAKSGSTIVNTYAFLDPGCSASFCTQHLMRKLNFSGVKTNILEIQNGAALFSRRSDSSAQIVCYLLLYVFLLSLFTRITSALFIYDKITLLDIGHCYTNLLQDTLSTDPTWPLEILRSTEVNKGHLNNPRRRTKHRGKLTGIRKRLRERAHSPPL